MAAAAMDLSSWAERNRREIAHRDAERLEISSNANRNPSSGKKPGNLKLAPIDLEPIAAKPSAAAAAAPRGRETVRDSYNRSLSLSPTARQDLSKRAQYEQANAEYMALLKREKSKKSKPKDEEPKRSARLPSLPIVKSSPTAEDRPSARTPPPLSNRATSARGGDPDSLSKSAAGGGPLSLTPTNGISLDPNGDDGAGDNDLGYFSGDEVGGVKKFKANRIRVIVRKRPKNDREGGEDAVECSGKNVDVCATKLRVDLTEYQESHHYEFDDACGADDTNRDVYEKVGRELITTVFEGGSASCFAYGQTGSGKTHTMIGSDDEPGIYVLAAEDIFARCQENHAVSVSLYEIYCNSLFDLLNQRQALHPREDANRRINICGLTSHKIQNVRDLLRVIERGALQRRTGSTSANEYSSRSHAVMTITLHDSNNPKFIGSLNVVDLAGSERAADTAANDKQTRLEGAEINKSLLALKECIRGLDEGKRHIQFRGSKLTEVLRDSFVGNSRTAMIATVSPSSNNAEHTLNTLRYAFRVKGLSIDCPMPSKERNAPRPTQRSKSTDLEMANRRAEKEREKKEKEDKAKRRKGHKRRTPRHAAGVIDAGSASIELDKIVEERVAQQVSAQVDALRMQWEEDRRRGQHELDLLREELRMMRLEQQQQRPPRLPPLTTAAADAAADHDDVRSSGMLRPASSTHPHGDNRPRSNGASRRSRRGHRASNNGSPTKESAGRPHANSFGAFAAAPTMPGASRTPRLHHNAAPLEEVVTLEELAL